jgi:hypothetical protein
MRQGIFSFLYLIAISSLFNIPLAFGEETTPADVTSSSEQLKQIEISGNVALEESEWVKSNYKQHLAQYRPWIHRAIGNLRLAANLGEHVRIIVAPEVKLWFDSYPQTERSNVQNYPSREHSYVSLSEAQGMLTFGNSETVSFIMAAGIMPFKSNPDARNLGEYLFRTGTRPPYIATSFDYAYSRLAGIRLSSTIYNDLSVDAFLTTETKMDPTLDWSLSFLIGYKLPSMIDVGAGISFDRLFPVTTVLSNPDVASNSYLNDTGGIEYFNFGGTKLIGRISFDPKGFLPSSFNDMLGKEDGKIYAEVGVLGTKNTQPYKWFKVMPMDTDSTLVVDSSKIFYTDIKKRIPVMFGFSVPTFKFFDYVSMEFEWYGWDYPNSTSGALNFSRAVPTPSPITGFSKDIYQKEDNWKYSFNAKKTVLKGFAVIGQIARDHTRHEVYYEAYRNEDEVFTQKDNWGWWLKLQYSF